jgi:Icc-related predicted phosphoesterase
MNILHYSDHNDQEATNKLMLSDILFLTGDLSIFDLKELKEPLQSKPGFGVYGNHCTKGYLEEMGIKNMHLSTTIVGNYTIGGYQGCLRYKESGEFQFTEEQAKRNLANFPRVDILLLHAPPFGLLDSPDDPVHKGSKSVRAYIDRHKPSYVFCGHESPSLEINYQGTKIFRTDGGRIIQI